MRIIVDTNILVSAARTPLGTTAKILLLAAEKRVELCVSPFILFELEEVLARPKIGFSPDKIRASVDAIKEIAAVVHPKVKVSVIQAE